MSRWNGEDQFPAVITIFSAPNYCDVYKNRGAVIKIFVYLIYILQDNTLNIKQYDYTPHPYVLPNFMNLFEWSIPFLCEKISEMFYTTITKRIPQRSFSTQTVVGTGKSKFCYYDKIETMSLRNKLKSIVLMIKLFKTLRKENEDILQLKGLCSNNKLPPGILLDGSAAIKDAIQMFKRAKELDAKNEKRPIN